MTTNDTLVSVALPVFNAGRRVERVVGSVLAQHHANLELIISDNGSTDETEEVCRDLARADSRIVYHRNPTNVGLVNNFIGAMHLARGDYFRWIGDDDQLEPDCLSLGVEALASDERLILATSGVSYVGPDGTKSSARYEGSGPGSSDPITRFREMLHLLNSSYLLIDPLYGMFRRRQILHLPRRNMLREDEVFAASLALAGPWTHIPEVLLIRHWKPEATSDVAAKLGVPAWNAHFATTLQCSEMIRTLDHFSLDADQRRAARHAVYGMFVGRQRIRAGRAWRRLAKLSKSAGAPVSATAA